MTHSAEQIDSLDSAFAAYLRAIDRQEQVGIGRAICRLESVSEPMGLRPSEPAPRFAVRILSRAGRY